MKNISIKITSNKLSIEKCYTFVQDKSCGGIALFVGTVRNKTKNKKVVSLIFTTYKSMAINEINKIAKRTLSDFNILKIAIHHAKGKLQVNDIPVIIAVSAPHRTAAFDACKFAIDSLKTKVPIWKKECFEDGEVWVNSHP